MPADRVERWYERSNIELANESFERRYLDPHIAKRIDYAADAFNTFAHKVSSAPVSPPSNAQ